MPKPPLPAHLQAVLAKPNPAIVGTVTPGGKPNTVATWYVWEDGRALVNMDEGRRRVEFLRRYPHVSLTVLDGQEWYRHITLHGRAQLQEDPDLTDIDRIARHYTGEPYPQRERGRVSAWIEVDSWHAWSGGRPWRRPSGPPPRGAAPGGLERRPALALT